MFEIDSTAHDGGAGGCTMMDCGCERCIKFSCNELTNAMACLGSSHDHAYVAASFELLLALSKALCC